MALVGDIIMAGRELFPDMPTGTIPAPGAELNTPTVVSTPAGGVSLPAATYYVSATYLNPWGETLGTASLATLVVGANQTIQITGTLPPGVTAIRLYLATAVNQWNQFFTGTTLPFIIRGDSGTSGNQPFKSSAFIPDTDGNLVSAATVYRWLGEAYDKAGLMTRGIRDESGFQTTVGVGTYAFPGRWTKINNAWFDGWLMSRQSTLNFYYHNTSTGISWMLDCSKVTNLGINVQVWPQANRTGSSSTLSAPMGSTDVAASVAVSTGFLPLGIAKIGTEIVAYSLTGVGQLLGLVRGLGGTTAQAWPTGTAVNELNVRIQGIRIPTKPTLGSAYQTVDLPFGWESVMTDYLVGRMRDAEQDVAAAKEKFDAFQLAMREYARSNRQLSGPVQVGGVARETYGSGLGGGWFLP